MSAYTTELRFICETLAGREESAGYDDVSEIISIARPKIFSFDYPIFDEAYKPTLETKILRHFYTREICAETYGRWKLFLEAKMNEIMPYYNQLYESERLEFEPLYDADYYREGTSEGTSSGASTSRSIDSGRDSTTREHEESTTLSGHDTTENDVTDTATLSGQDKLTKNITETSTLSGQDETESEEHNRDIYSEWNLYSDTPQGGIAGIQGAEDPPSLVDNGYLTNARHIIHDGAGTERNTDSVTHYGKVDEKETEGDETTKYGKVDTRVIDGEQTTTYGKTSDTEGGSTEHIDYGKTNNTTGTTTGEKAEEFAHHTYGRMGGRTGAELLMEYRKTFLNIDMEIIKALEPLFFGLW